MTNFMSELYGFEKNKCKFDRIQTLITSWLLNLKKYHMMMAEDSDAAYINDTGGFWHFHPEYELVLNIKSNGTRIIGDSVELFDQYDMVLIAGNIPHCWNYIQAEKYLPDNHGIIVHFKLVSSEMHCCHNMKCIVSGILLSAGGKGYWFFSRRCKIAEKYLVQMVNNKGIDKMIDFFNVH